MHEERRVIVIGSGPAGAMAARELLRNGVPVTMLESGMDFQRGMLVRLGGRNLYRKFPPLVTESRHTASGDPDTNWYYTLAPGGLSSQWTGAVPRFAPEDFTEGARLHERYRWPVTYEEMAPYYTSAERLLQITAGTGDVSNLPAGSAAYRRSLPADWEPVANAAAEFGQGLTMLPLADGPNALVARRGTAFNSFTNIVEKLCEDPRFSLITGAHALRLEYAPLHRRVRRVIYFDRRKGVQRCLPAEGIVIACGALHSTKLLFDSACPDFPEGLGNSEGIVGRFLHDHPQEWWVLDVERPVALLSPPAYLTRAPHQASPPLLAASWTLGVVGTADKIRSRLRLKSSAVGVQIFGTMIPTETHHVKPAAEKRDAFGQPSLDVCIHYETPVIENVIRARHRLLEIMERAGYPASIRQVEHRMVPGNSVHYGGTVRMHRSRKYGVLDAWNRMYDVPNVVVCDASCFPTGSEKNPTLTVMALAARAAERLAYDLKAG